MEDRVYTAVGAPNIALIKYWGKRDNKLILPYNSSISMTLSNPLYTKTSVVFSRKLRKDAIFINGVEQDLEDPEAAERFAILGRLRELAGSNAHALIVSKNSFPTSAGIASSASGAATLAFAVSKALGIALSSQELSIFARQVSGSACRSTLGGFVKWRRGVKADGSDSFAVQIRDENHWPELIDVIAIVSLSKKKVSSRSGMKQSVETSVLYNSRIRHAEEAAGRLETAIKNRDFETFAEITMRDSNDMHAIMLDTWPPIFYMNDISRDVIYAVHELNAKEKHTVAAYTFDAGPNAHIIALEKNKQIVYNALRNIRGVRSVLESHVGGGPRLLEENKAHLIDAKLFKPKFRN